MANLVNNPIAMTTINLTQDMFEYKQTKIKN